MAIKNLDMETQNEITIYTVSEGDKKRKKRLLKLRLLRRHRRKLYDLSWPLCGSQGRSNELSQVMIFSVQHSKERRLRRRKR
jgi:hypothetical protein